MSKSINNSSLFTKLTTVLKSKKIFIIFVLLSYVFFTVIYMGPSTWNCTDTLSGLGDSTGGPIWRAGITPEQPLMGGYEMITNYPTGENLYSPVGYASFLQTVMMKTGAKVVGAVCAYNTLNMIGYLATAVTMFAFIYWLVRSRWIAWLAGFAVAFTPYVQSKIGGHPSYGYAALLIAALWLTLLIIKHKKMRYGVGLASILAICCYFDPYFILLSATVVGPLVLVWLSLSLYDLKKNSTTFDDIKQTIKVLAVSLLSLIILISPLAYVRINDAAAINSATSAVRGNIMDAAQLCSNLPQDYLLPDPYNSFMIKVFGLGYTASNISLRHWCGPGESRVSISLTVIIVILLGAIFFLKRRKDKSSIKYDTLFNYDTKLLVGGVAFIGLTAFMLGLPPKIYGIPMPSAYVIYVTETWRIFAREYLVLNMAAVTLFAIVLRYLSGIAKSEHKKYLKLAFIVLFGLIFMEYQFHDPFRPFTFSYQRDVPQIYRQIKNDTSVKALAEFPLDRLGIESDVIVYYTTMQGVHKKAILNSATMNNVNEKLHISIKDLSDPQTIPILRTLGITHITTHGLSEEQVLAQTDQLEIVRVETPPVYGLTMLRSASSNTIILAKIKEGPKAESAVVMQEGFAVNLNIMKSPVEMQYETLPDPVLGIIALDASSDKNRLYDVCFDIKMASPGDISDVLITIDGLIVNQLRVGDTYSRVILKAKNTDRIVVDNLANHNTRIDNLGCRSGEVK